MKLAMLKSHVIRNTMERSNDVFWIIHDDHYKVDELDEKDLWLLKPANANRYHWVTIKVVGTPSIFYIFEAIVNVDITIKKLRGKQNPKFVLSRSHSNLNGNMITQSPNQIFLRV